jgi:quinol monooxygenase YgiN
LHKPTPIADLPAGAWTGSRLACRLMIVVTGRVKVPAEARERFTEVATEMCSRSRKEQGCRSYRVYGDLERPARYVFLEEWDDDASLQRHFGEQHTQTFLAALGRLLAEPADALFHTTATTRRLDPARGLVALD